MPDSTIARGIVLAESLISPASTGASSKPSNANAITAIRESVFTDPKSGTTLAHVIVVATPNRCQAQPALATMIAAIDHVATAPKFWSHLARWTPMMLSSVTAHSDTMQ